MKHLAELEIGDWITPRKGGGVYQVTAFDRGDGEVVLARYPLSDGYVITRSMHQIYNGWRSAYHKDQSRVRAA